MFAWSRTWYAQKDGVVYNFESKKNRDDAVKNHGFTKMSARDAYDHPIVKVFWRQYDNFITQQAAN